MKQDYFNTLTKEIIENNDKEKAIEIIANKLNEKQLSNEKEILTNIEKGKEIEKLREHTSNQDRIIAEANNRIYKAIEYIDRRDIEWGSEEHNKLLTILKGSDKE